MRKYLLPAVVCAAIGALVLLFLKRDEKATPQQPPRTPTVSAVEPAPESPLGKPAETRTRLDEHRWMRELERSLAGDLKDAGYFRQKVCEDMPAILASEKLSNDLLATIKEYIDSEDDARRDIVIPILRVFENPEATRLIADRFYKAKDEAEQMTLLEAMSKPFHDPNQACIWGVDKALNSPSPENRERAFDIMQHFVVDNDLLISASMQVYQGSLDERQRQIALRTICDRGEFSANAREFARGLLKRPNNMQDVATIMGSLMNWGDENDAAQLERLADEYPALGEPLRDHARMMRRILGDAKHSPNREEIERREQEDAAREEAKRKEREATGGDGGGGTKGG